MFRSGVSGLLLEDRAALLLSRAEVPGRVDLCRGGFSAKWRWESEETTEIIEGLKTSLVQKGLVVPAQETITEGYNKSGTEYWKVVQWSTILWANSGEDEES